MKIPQLRMESQFAKIQINQTDAKLGIKQEPAKLHIEQPKAEVSIQTRPGKLTIDQTKAFEDMNLMSILRRNDNFAAEAMQAAQQGVARIASEGRQLMEIENGGNVIAAQAKQRGTPPMKALGIKFIPSTFAVKIDYQPAEVSIDVKTNKPIIRAEMNPPQFTYHPGQVETTLVQRSFLNIEVVDQ